MFALRYIWNPPKKSARAVRTVEGEGSDCFHSKQDRIVAIVAGRGPSDLYVRLLSHPFTKPLPHVFQWRTLTAATTTASTRFERKEHFR